MSMRNFKPEDRETLFVEGYLSKRVRAGRLASLWL